MSEQVTGALGSDHSSFLQTMFERNKPRQRAKRAVLKLGILCVFPTASERFHSSECLIYFNRKMKL